MTMPDGEQVRRDDRLLVMLQRLLAIRALELRPALTEASTLIAETFGADKVDVFVYQPDTETLVALACLRKRSRATASCDDYSKVEIVPSSCSC